MSRIDELINKCNRRIILSRTRILMNNGFYGLLLMHMKFALDESIETASTDGTRIYFSPKFMDELSDSELDFVLMHEILHVALRHCIRTGEKDNELFNIACDIVVNSNILYSNKMDINTITLKKYGVSMHLTPNKDEGYKYTAEEVYNMLIKNGYNKKKKGSNNGSGEGDGSSPGKDEKGKKQKNGSGSGTGDNENGERWDEHNKWSESLPDKFLEDTWIKRVIDAASSVSVQNASSNRGIMPSFAKRLVDEFLNPQTDWKTLLNDFIQEEVCDYSFSPPDKRYYDSPFFLPDFNDTDYIVADILFMIDTSGSMSDEMLTRAYSEIKGAIDQFDGKLKGLLGFFDASIVEPIPFESVEDLRSIRPYGGGGTRFDIIFEYVNKFMSDNLPKSIIILTDGYAPFPDISETMGIPVLWLINNDIVTPPWGRVARVKL